MPHCTPAWVTNRPCFKEKKIRQKVLALTGKLAIMKFNGRKYKFLLKVQMISLYNKNTSDPADVTKKEEKGGKKNREKPS